MNPAPVPDVLCEGPGTLRPGCSDWGNRCEDDMDWIMYVVATLFTLLGGVCVFSVVIGLPGTWIILGLAFLIELVDVTYLPEGATQTFTWWILIVSVVLAVIGEILEFIAGMLGAKRSGSTNRGMWGAFIGGLLGALFGTAIPVPLVGTLIGAVIGTFVGAIVGELGKQGEVRLADTYRPAMGATIGRVLGTLSKMPIAIAVWIMLSIGAFWP